MPEIVPLGPGHDRVAFDCGSAELNAFFKATARQHAAKGISRTWVLADPNAPESLSVFSPWRYAKYMHSIFPPNMPGNTRNILLPLFGSPDSLCRQSIEGKDTAKCFSWKRSIAPF